MLLLTVPGRVKSVLCTTLCLIWLLKRRTHTFWRYSGEICKNTTGPLSLEILCMKEVSRLFISQQCPLLLKGICKSFMHNYPGRSAKCVLKKQHVICNTQSLWVTLWTTRQLVCVLCVCPSLEPLFALFLSTCVHVYVLAYPPIKQTYHLSADSGLQWVDQISSDSNQVAIVSLHLVVLPHVTGNAAVWFDQLEL